MATIHVPPLDLEPMGAGWVRQALAMLAPILIIVLAATGSAFGGAAVLDRLTTLPVIDEPTPAPDVVIRPGSGPAVGATARSRILGLDCTLRGPIEAAVDDSGAYVVTSVADQVRCANGRFREGFTLRWPAGRPPTTEPLP
jgi:hypothetical protein